MNIIPKPKHLTYTKEILKINGSFQFVVNGSQLLTTRSVKKLVTDFPSYIFGAHGTPIVFSQDNELAEEQYKILIDHRSINLFYQNETGCYYAICTLKQILKQNSGGVLNGIIIDDSPDFKHRGLMLDISRNRVYKVDTFYKIIDLMSDLKMNQLQFNVEGNSYYYPSKDSYYDDPSDMLTKEDVIKIDFYAKERYIKLIPNQNSFGHMSFWLNQKEFNHLAECPEGFTYKWMVNSPSSTLNPKLDDSFLFVQSLFDEYLQGFSEKIVNIGADEPFELGFGASKHEVEKDGRAIVYARFIKKLYDSMNDKNYKVMMWGDVIKNHSEILELLPKDIIALEWGYDENDFKEEDLQKYVDKGFEYYVCPGTSMWNSIVGIHDNMLKNIKRAARVGKKYMATGLLNTDWGDGGSWQQLSLSYFPYAIGAAYAWNADTEQDEMVLDYLDREIYMDASKQMSRMMLRLGNSYQIETEKAANATQLFKLLYIQQTDHINFGTNLSDPMFIIKDRRLLSLEEYKNYEIFFTSMLADYRKIDYKMADRQIVDHEILFSLKILLVASKLGIALVDLYSHKIDEFKAMLSLFNEAMNHYQIAWNERNKESDYKLSTMRMIDLRNKLEGIVKIH
ncbi:MAG: family 20 glycosylhydrolase [Acholeplasmataceae bacterium]|nr:family 20 glycosylhydrolase [Acholeplasmataceae bacterium]